MRRSRGVSAFSPGESGWLLPVCCTCRRSPAPQEPLALLLFAWQLRRVSAGLIQKRLLLRPPTHPELTWIHISGGPKQLQPPGDPDRPGLETQPPALERLRNVELFAPHIWLSTAAQAKLLISDLDLKPGRNPQSPLKL